MIPINYIGLVILIFKDGKISIEYYNERFWSSFIYDISVMKNMNEILNRWNIARTKYNFPLINEVIPIEEFWERLEKNASKDI